MYKWFKDILPDKDPYHNRGRDQMRKKEGPEFERLRQNVIRSTLARFIQNVLRSTLLHANKTIKNAFNS